jgi:hypothetical protein
MQKKHITFTTILLLIILSPIGLLAEENNEKGFSFGVSFMSGVRYDNLRMCVATDAGVKGGPMADIMLSTKYTLTDEYALTFNLPVMRPILFGYAFEMLQFEPEFTFEYTINFKNGPDIVLGSGLGVSVHYGPDYKSDMDNKSDSFYAAGPFISGLTGLAFNSFGETKSMVGLRFFYVPLFTSERGTGTVLGIALEYTIYF